MKRENVVAHFTDDNGHRHRRLAPWPTEDVELCKEVASRTVGTTVSGPILFLEPDQAEIDRIEETLREIDSWPMP